MKKRRSPYFRKHRNDRFARETRALIEAQRTYVVERPHEVRVETKK